MSSEPPDSDADAGSIRYDWLASGQPSEVVVEAVATVTGRDQLSLPPLVNGSSSDTERPVRARFVYADVEVTIDGDGEIELRPVPDDAERASCR